MYRVLVVDDEPMNLEIITQTLADDGLDIDTASNGQEALARISDQDYDLVLLDRMMPVMDGITLLRAIKAVPAWRELPVVMQTAAASPAEVREGIAAGAHYYLTKPYEPDALRMLTLSILQDVGMRRQARAASGHLETLLGHLDQAEFHFRSIAEANALAAALANLCPDPALAMSGLAELLVNAVEHGNLGIGYEKKTEFKWAGRWEEEITRRLTDPVLGRRLASVAVRQSPAEVRFTIRDQGAGFDWSRYLEFSPERAFDLHGRGIAMANTLCFNQLEYQGTGNTVVATLSRQIFAPS